MKSEFHPVVFRVRVKRLAARVVCIASFADASSEIHSGIVALAVALFSAVNYNLAERTSAQGVGIVAVARCGSL